ncbi:hypothetical protein ALI144C_12630 [Actinosynnema sp. ALI-1.44]|nr:hypothetical protein ALI144C_12630 [Actinosynnema sp. ALI-1.44]
MLARVITAVLLVVPPGPAAADEQPTCAGGFAPNPSVEEIAANGQPAGYTFEPTWSVPPGTPAAEHPRLSVDKSNPVSGEHNATISTPAGRVSTAYETIPTVIPNGTYHLVVGAGTHDVSQNQPIGLRFYDKDGTQVAERSVQADHDIDTDNKLGRFDLGPTIAPASTTMVRFFAATNANWLKWDCVHLTISPPNSR